MAQQHDTIPSIGELAKQAPVFQVEFRGNKEEEIKWTDKKTGNARSMWKRTYFCETLGEETSQVAIEEFAPMGSSELPAKIEGLTKGSTITVVIDSMKTSQGVTSIRASKIYPVQKAAGK